MASAWTSTPRVRGSGSRPPARATTFPATRSSRHFLDEADVSLLPFRQPPPTPPAGETGEPGMSTALRVARKRVCCAISAPSPIASARARSRASIARVPDASSFVVFATLVADRHPTIALSFPSSQNSVEFGEGLLNKGKAKKREKRPLTQIEIMAAVEREKQEKKAARRAAKVRAPPRSETRRLPSQHETQKPVARIPGDFYPRERANRRGGERQVGSHFRFFCEVLGAHLAPLPSVSPTARRVFSGSQG